ncbi:MAG TPA: dihydrodipicolinate synthase family protein [Pyrinomonadaceae bacterium]|nr:dihydrodipicolinate synthase family protein [Pyrinomonadaceae bacterium]
MDKLRGIFLPFPTPFDSEGEVNARALRSNIERWNETGAAGYVALGSTGERVHLSERERFHVIETARSAVPEELTFVVGVGEQSTRATVDEARRVAALGADALLVITPHFYRSQMTTDALVAHYEAVADSSPAPVILYSVPQNTGVALAPEAVARLSAHPNVVGLKDSSGDFVNFMETARLVGERLANGSDESADGRGESFALLTGHASTLYAALATGARGGILAAACVAPRLCVEIYEAFVVGDAARARALQAALVPLARAVTTRYGIGGLKAALDAAGYAGGAVRAPLSAPVEEARREIARLVEECESRTASARTAAGRVE